MQISDVVSAVQPALDVLPGLLGAESPKNYLLVFQNNAESLPLGGSAASQTMIRADAGDLEITGQSSSAVMDRDRRSIGIEVSDTLRTLWGNNYGTRVNMSTTRPDWPSAAQMVAAFWNRTMDDTPIDGAISDRPDRALPNPPRHAARSPFRVPTETSNSPARTRSRCC